MGEAFREKMVDPWTQELQSIVRAGPVGHNWGAGGWEDAMSIYV